MRFNSILVPFRQPDPSLVNKSMLPGLIWRHLFAGVTALILSTPSAAAQSPPPDPPPAAHQVKVAPSAVTQPAIKPRKEPAAQTSRRAKRRKVAQSQGGTLTGARLIPFRSQAVRATVGFPDIEVAYHFPYTPEIELIPRIQIAGGRNLSTSPTFMEIGSDARKELYRKGKWTVAGFASTFIHLNMNEDDPVHYAHTGGFGIGLGCPGVVATYAHNSDFDINFSAQLQDIIYLGDNSAFEMNLPLSVGFEYAFSKRIRLVQRTEFGPDIYVGERTDLQLRTYLGAGYSF